MSRIAITGGAGFVGRHVVSLLLRDGHEVRIMVRPGGVSDAFGQEVRVVQGDVRNLDSVRSLIHDCDLVVHLAASMSGDDDVAEIIAAGTQNVVSAARDAGIERLVSMSCLAADAASHSPFFAAKWKAEQLVRGSGVPYVILRPSLVVGRGDGVTAPLAEVARSVPVIPIPRGTEYRQQPVDVDDLARCVQLSLFEDSLANLEISVGGPVYLTLRQLVDLIQGAVGVLKPKVAIPPAWFSTISGLLPASARELYGAPRLAQFQQMSAASPGIVQRVFGFEPRSILPVLGAYML